MKKILLSFFLLVLFWTNNAFSANTYDWNLNYNNNIVECVNQSRNNTSGTKYIPKTNNTSASPSANWNLCESYWYFWWNWSTRYHINNNYLCPNKWYASILERRNSNTEYRVFCKTKFDDASVELNSAPLENKSIVADWHNKNVEISFPLSVVESSIDYIDFHFIITDNTSINWLSKNKNTLGSSAVTIVDTTTSDSFSSQTRTVNYRLTNGSNLDTMKSWDKFNFIYKFYNPTEIASDIFPATVDWFIFKTIKYDIKFTDGGTISWYYVENKSDNTNINNSTIPVKLKPIIEINNTWILAWSWFVEWTTQTGAIDIINNSWSTNLSSAWFFLSITWSTTKPESKDYFTGTWEINNNWTNIDIDKWTLINSFFSNFSDWIKYVLKTLFTLDNTTLWYIDDIKNIRLREFVKYTVWWKEVIYLAWVLNTNNTNKFETLKIYWRTNISDKKQKDLLSNQGVKDIHNLAWNITKASLKRDIRKRAINTIKFIDTTSMSISDITKIDGINWDISNWWKSIWNILYYEYSWSNAWKNAVIDDSTNKFSGKKTLIVRWWNVRIKSNIINSSTSDILWIIVLKDDHWNWGKLYIDSSVDEVDAVIYLDKSIIWYNDIYDNWDTDDIIKHEVDWNINDNILNNQLYIYWSVFSENTIWWSRLDENNDWIFVCPYWTSLENIVCNTINSQKYDFNYLRKWLGISPKFVPSAWPNYPVVIKYNSSIQSGPPPLFSEK